MLTTETASLIERLRMIVGKPAAHIKWTESDRADLNEAIAALERAEGERDEALGALEPFASFNADGFGTIMVEVVPSSPDNPSRRIEPILLDRFRRAAEVYSRLSQQGGKTSG